MNCPKCNTEMIAIGGIPTTWQCSVCKNGKVLALFTGDTLDTLVEI